jgi:hypothetical protein
VPGDHAATVGAIPRAVVVRPDEPRLLRKEEIARTPLRPDERRFTATADEISRPNRHGAGMVTTAPVTAPPATRIRLGRGARRTVLTAHVVSGVGLLGSVAAVLAINVRAATTADADLAAASYDLLAMFTVLFGIPLSMTALATGVLLGLASKWGVVKTGWVAIKLVLLLGVILVGALVLGPGTDAMRNGDGGAEARLIAGSAYDVVALLAATGLSVFKPRRRRRPKAS